MRDTLYDQEVLIRKVRMENHPSANKILFMLIRSEVNHVFHIHHNCRFVRFQVLIDVPTATAESESSYLIIYKVLATEEDQSYPSCNEDCPMKLPFDPRSHRQVLT